MTAETDTLRILLARAEAEVSIITTERDRMKVERDAAYQAMFDGLVILGFDNDGDKTPWPLLTGMGHDKFIQMFLRDLRQYRHDVEEEWATVPLTVDEQERLNDVATDALSAVERTINPDFNGPGDACGSCGQLHGHLPTCQWYGWNKENKA